MRTFLGTLLLLAITWNSQAQTSAAGLPPSTNACLTGTLASGVIAFYPFGNGSLNDASGGGHFLMNPTGAMPTFDRNGNPQCAYHFDKTMGNYLTNPGGMSTFLDFLTTSPFSISLWYRPTNINRGPVDYELLVGRGDVNTSYLHCPDTWGEWSAGLYDCSRAVVGFDMDRTWDNFTSTGTCYSHIVATTNVWHHLVFVFDGTNRDLYLDGVLTSAPTSISGCPLGTAWMSGNVGELLMGVDYTGDLDDILIYNRALSSTEVSDLGRLPGCCDNTPIQPQQGKAGIQQGQHQQGLNAYPNPTSDLVSVTAGGAIIRSVAVYSNVDGRLVRTFSFNAASADVHLNDLAPGIYLLKIATDKETITQKVTKE